ncbi:MAG: tetratricopeptide repeat protein [Woeseiaceae bacterium]
MLLCLSVLAACASAPRSADDAAGSVAAGPNRPQREIPAEVLTLYEQAVAVMAAGDGVDAELRFEEFLLQYPDYPGAHVNLAILHAKSGDDQAAEASIAKALMLEPSHPAALNQLGMLRRRQGRFEEAESAYLKAVTADPDYALAHYNLGVLNELYLRRLDNALQHFERYRELGGDDEQVVMWIADLKRRVAATQRTANAAE